jgi:hypothetical protein
MKTFYVQNNSLYNPFHERIEEPSIIIDGDVCLKIGSYPILSLYYKELVQVKPFKDAVFIRFDPQKIPIEDIAYICHRCMEFTHTGFAYQFIVNWGSDKFLTWLMEEQKRIPIDTTPPINQE